MKTFIERAVLFTCAVLLLASCSTPELRLTQIVGRMATAAVAMVVLMEDVVTRD